MRTTKQNIIELDPGESIIVRSMGHEVSIHSIQMEEDAGGPDNTLLEIELPLGSVMSGLSYLRLGNQMYGDLAFAEADKGIREELYGPLRFITFRNLPIVEGFTEDQKEYLERIGINLPDDA